MLIRSLVEADFDAINRFAYERERENIFLIESLRRQNAFTENLYLGAFDEETLIAVATYFGRFNSLIVHGDMPSIINKLVDRFVEEGKELSAILDLEKYASYTMERLKFHGIAPTRVLEETFYEVTNETFKPVPSSRTSGATKEDIDVLIRSARLLDGKDPDAPILESERRMITPEYVTVLRDEKGSIIAHAGIHAYSEHFAIVGGVMTLPTHRGKGLAKETVSAVSTHWLLRGKSIVLFCSNTNEPAKHIYTSMGFRPLEGFLIAFY